MRLLIRKWVGKEMEGCVVGEEGCRVYRGWRKGEGFG